MRSPLQRRLARRLMIVIVGGLTASGVLLAVAALVAVLFNRGSLGVALFIASSVVLAVLTFGWAVAMTVLRVSGRSTWSTPSRDQPPDNGQRTRENSQ